MTGSETYTAGAAAALTADVYRERAFVKIEFPGYTFRVWSGVGPYMLNGETYTGAGPLGTISTISEDADFTAEPVLLTLSGLDATLAGELCDFTHQGSIVTIAVAFFDVNETLIPDPVTPFIGVVDTMSMSLGETLSISVHADHYLRLLFRGPDGHRRMQSDQETIFPADVGLEFAARLADSVPWGVPTKIANNNPTSGPGSSNLSQFRSLPGY